jgi:hypothetical protein
VDSALGRLKARPLTARRSRLARRLMRLIKALDVTGRGGVSEAEHAASERLGRTQGLALRERKGQMGRGIQGNGQPPVGGRRR